MYDLPNVVLAYMAMYDLPNVVLAYMAMYHLPNVVLAYMAMYHLPNVVLAYMAMYDLPNVVLAFMAMYDLPNVVLAFMAMYDLPNVVLAFMAMYDFPNVVFSYMAMYDLPNVVLAFMAMYDLPDVRMSTGTSYGDVWKRKRKKIGDAEGNVNLKPPAKYANLIDEVDWVEFVTYRTQDEKFLKISELNRKRASNPIYPYRASRKGYRGVEEKIVSYPKRNLWTVDSQVTLEKALGLRQYPNRIRCAGFGAIKQFMAPSAKRATKADRLESGKFVEGPEASTTVKESFTHPRNYILIPKGIIINCKLFLDTPCTRAVAIGTTYNIHDAMIHNAQIPSNHLKVSIDISIEDDALLPIPVDEDIITVRLALGSFVAWPKHLIDVVPIMGMMSADHSSTSLPIIDEPASKKAKVVKSKPQSYLYDNFVPRSKKKVMFLSPHSNTFGVGAINNDTGKNQQSQYVAEILEKNNENAALFLAPLNSGTLNIYSVLNPKRQKPVNWTHVKI
ncbi:hypothetical protein Lal_00037792 [Lupinus albus]|nr:hypothetical protein Lal_00037792 [Lupinus albus]